VGFGHRVRIGGALPRASVAAPISHRAQCLPTSREIVYSGGRWFTRRSKAMETSASTNEVLPERPNAVKLTERAAEMVVEAMKQEELSGHGLRVGVIGGGCAGLQYLLDFSDKKNDIDFVSEQYGVRVVIDPFSAGLLEGTTIDYVDGPQGTGFKFDNPNTIRRTCGCGSSFH
jgi:iron-sulfur cluster assembly accessory protein